MKKYLISTLVLFVFIFVYDWIVHGFLLSDIYDQFRSLWRSEAEMAALLPFTVVMDLLYAGAITLLYRNSRASGLTFGLYLGFLIAVLNAMGYAYLPISVTLAGVWAAVAFIQSLGAGLILGWVHKN